MQPCKDEVWLEAIDYAMEAAGSPDWQEGPQMPPFRFCPFCGRELLKKQEEVNNG